MAGKDLLGDIFASGLTFLEIRNAFFLNLISDEMMVLQQSHVIGIHQALG